jgi:hypothetical protein
VYIQYIICNHHISSFEDHDYIMYLVIGNY